MATVLTKSGMPLVKYVAEILGYLMNGIYLLLDKAGRLQIPKEYLSALGINGGDKVRVELDGDKISIYKQ